MSAASPFANNQEPTVGKYRFIASLGHGGMADVYLAVLAGPAGFNKLQVVKKLRRDYVEDPDHIEMFLDEARLAARLNHPNVVQTFEVSESEGEYFMAMEYLEGATMNRIINRAKASPPPPGVLLRMVADALAGLHYAHDLADYDGKPLHIVHRDASPHNIIVTYDGQTKILDFGIAKSEVRSGETRTGIVKGKIGYMAPEQARCRPLDRRADIFVLGIVLWEILAGRKLWDKASDIEVLHRLATGELPRVEEVRPDVPEPLARMCARALALDPWNRYATAAEMRADIVAYLDFAGIRVSTEDVGQYVAAQFGDKRVEIRKVVERQLSKLKAGVSAGVGLADLAGAADPAPDSMSLPRISQSGRHSVGSGSGSGSGSSSNARIVPSFTSVPPPAAHPPGQTASTAMQAAAPATTPAATPNRGAMFVAGAIVLASALGAYVVLHSRQTPSAEPGTPPATAMEARAAATPETSAGVVASAANAPEAQTTIELRVRAIPASADIFLDGARLPTNPFTGKFPADGVGHRVRAEAWDHRPTARIVTFEKDTSIELVLEPKGSAQGRAAADPNSNDEPEGTSTSSAPPAPTSDTTAAATTGKPKRQLGDGDPFKTPAPKSTTTVKKRELGEGQSPW